MIGHIRHANVGSVNLANTHPSVGTGRPLLSFAHNGQLQISIPSRALLPAGGRYR